MFDYPKLHEWNLLKDEFDALVHNKGVREDNLEQVLDNQIRRRFGELIAAGHKGLSWPLATGPISRQSVTAARNAYAADLRMPNAFNARSITCFGSRSPLAVTLTIDFAISSVIGSSRSVVPTSTKAAS